MSRFVVSHVGPRDFYELALALQERDRLDQLVTTFFNDGGLLGKPFARTERQRPALDNELVFNSAQAGFFEILQRLGKLGNQRRFGEMANSTLARKAGQFALRNGSHLFLYREYAYEALADPALQDRVRGLFYFHPHDHLQYELLKADAARFPEAKEGFASFSEYDPEARDNIEHRFASHIMAASEFTKRSLVEEGYPPERIWVVPYGFTSAVHAPSHKLDPEPVQFLFVGKGVQRKGLHHLLRVWRDLNLRDAKLTIVARLWENAIRRDLADQPNVEWNEGMDRDALLGAFGSSHVFVMPSLVEGFGHVYLEAASMGCHLIGTHNSGLPDLAFDENVRTLCEAGDLDGLAEAIKSVHAKVKAGKIDYRSIAEQARAYTWERFRSGVNEAVDAWLDEDRG
jgi:glycosyltransferase involved in cell wall biosynthesis